MEKGTVWETFENCVMEKIHLVMKNSPSELVSRPESRPKSRPELRPGATLPPEAAGHCPQTASPGRTVSCPAMSTHSAVVALKDHHAKQIVVLSSRVFSVPWPCVLETGTSKPRNSKSIGVKVISQSSPSSDAQAVML